MLRLFSTVILFTFLFLATPLAAQWEKMPSPGLDNIEQVVRSGNVLYARSDRAVYRSADLGASWEELSGISTSTVYSIAVWGDTLFAVIEDLGYKLRFSRDHGANWQVIDHLPGLVAASVEVFDNHLIGFLGASIVGKRNLATGGDWEPQDQLGNFKAADGFWWGSRGGGNVDTIFRSSDFGSTWTPVTTMSRLNEFEIQGGTLIATTYDYPSPYLLRKTGDFSSSPWDTVLAAPPIENIYLRRSGNRCLAQFAGTVGRLTILGSDDGFENWDTLNIPLEVSFPFLGSTFKDVHMGAKWLAPGGPGGVAVSDDDGARWYFIETGLHNDLPVQKPFGQKMRQTGAWLCVDMEYHATMYSRTGGKSWFRPIVGRSRPFQPAVYTQGYYFGWGSVGNINFVVHDFCDSLYRSPNGLSDWELIQPTGFTTCGKFLFTFRNHLYAHLQDLSDKALARSADAGETWTFFDPPLVSNGSMDTLGDQLILYNNQEIWVSTDEGQSFSKTGQFPVQMYNVVFADSAIFCAADGVLYRSDNLGGTWELYAKNLTDLNGAAIRVWAFDHRAGRTIVYGQSTAWPSPVKGLWFTDDLGQSWREGLPLPDSLLPQQSFNLKITEEYLFIYGENCSRLPLDRLENFASRGRIFLDADADGEAGPGDRYLTASAVKALPFGQQAATDSSGQYVLFANLIADTLIPLLPSPHASAMPAFRIATSPAENQDFAIQLIPNLNDLQLELTPHAPFRPGFETAISLEGRNLGSTAAAPRIPLWALTIRMIKLSYRAIIPLSISRQGLL